MFRSCRLYASTGARAAVWDACRRQASVDRFGFRTHIGVMRPCTAG